MAKAFNPDTLEVDFPTTLPITTHIDVVIEPSSFSWEKLQEVRDLMTKSMEHANREAMHKAFYGGFDFAGSDTHRNQRHQPTMHQRPTRHELRGHGTNFVVFDSLSGNDLWMDEWVNLSVKPLPRPHYTNTYNYVETPYYD